MADKIQALEEQINGISAKGLPNLSRDELIQLALLYEAQTGLYGPKRKRAHISGEAFHKVLDAPHLSLEQKCQLIVDGLADKYAELAFGHKLGFDGVAIYLPTESNDLKLVDSQGDHFDQIVKAGIGIAQYREHLQFVSTNSAQTEYVIPLVANKTYQGAIVVRRNSGIDVEDLFGFFYRYGDMAAGAVVSALEHRRLSEETERANRLTRDMRSMTEKIVHDLKRPLISIGGFARLLHKPIEDERRREYAAIITEEVGNVEVLVNDLLDFARIESGEKPEITPYKLNEGIQTILEKVVKGAQQKNMHISYTPNPTTAEINSNRLAIGSILKNLLENAIVYGEPNDNIDLRVERASKGIYIYVSNAGYISDTAKTFRKFYSTREGNGGTGLGLINIKGFAELLGGHVKVDNIQTDGKNRVQFEVYLPQ